MLLYELFNIDYHFDTEEFSKRASSAEQTYNTEAWTRRKEQEDKYKNIDYERSTPVFTTDPKDPEEREFSNQPDSWETASPGYRGKRVVKQRAGHIKNLKPSDNKPKGKK